MDRVTARAVADLRALPSVSDVGATLGRAVSGDQIVDTNSGQLYVQVKPGADYDRAVAAIRGVVQGFPGIRASVSTYESDIQASVLAPSDNTVTVRVYGQDYSTLHSLATQVQAQMSHIDGVGRPQVSAPTMEPNINVTVNDSKAHDAGGRRRRSRSRGRSQ